MRVDCDVDPHIRRNGVRAGELPLPHAEPVAIDRQAAAHLRLVAGDRRLVQRG
jgi:hypothetical protein